MKYSTDVECRSDSLAVISYRDINQFTYVNLSYAAQPAAQSIFEIHHPPLLGVRGQDKGPLPEGMLLNERQL
jgi:hypothetical protein